MKSVKSKKMKKLRLFLVIFGILFLVLIIFWFFKKVERKNQSLDYKLGIVASDGIALVSISNERKMINELKLGEEVNVWIPNGMSWYSNNKVKNILKQEKKLDLAKDIFWYNFGFFPDKILVLDSINKWKSDSILINNLGFLNWLEYKKNYGKMLFKQEKIDENLGESELFLSEILVRDFSESKINNEELRVSIFNNTDEGGLASFIAKRLEWSGFSVVSTDNNSEEIDKCLIVYGNKTDLNCGWILINKIFNCDTKKDETLSENELELYFGDKFSSMIEYPSYFK
jgi:LytR cell envelope-related transcriptional attenuator